VSGVVPVRHFPNVVSELASLFPFHEVTILMNALSRRIFAQLSGLRKESDPNSNGINFSHQIYLPTLRRENLAA
jgi:hypothetical protein